MRVKEERERLRAELMFVEEDRRKEIEVLRAKLEVNYAEEIETIKKTHLTSIQML